MLATAGPSCSTMLQMFVVKILISFVQTFDADHKMMTGPGPVNACCINP